jgi:Restriction endonuclease BamHI
MKIVETHDVFAVGDFPKSEEWRSACVQVEEAIIATDWPHGSGKFTIYPQSGKKRREGNGVVPIKKPCIDRLRRYGWLTEKLPPLQRGVMNPGDLDALYQCDKGFIGFEWETGNISSSHRAVNKLMLTMQLGGLIGGFLVVPSDNLKVFLTDRIGNIGELRPYLPLWSSIPISEGVLRIEVVEHDATSLDVPRIPKGTDGRAVQ